LLRRQFLSGILHSIRHITQGLQNKARPDGHIVSHPSPMARLNPLRPVLIADFHRQSSVDALIYPGAHQVIKVREPDFISRQEQRKVFGVGIGIVYEIIEDHPMKKGFSIKGRAG
jgi:hypothetical protein